MNNLFLLEGFSNYFNKQVKRFDVVEDYLLKCKKYENMRSINFVFGDGINTSQILQTKIKINPDYLIVTNENNEIVGRRFIIENDNLRNGQSKLTLKRDVVAEKIDEILDAEMLIERANVDSDNPLFFVSENESFNQIKQSEYLLKDETGTNWIVGYIARDTNIEGEISSIKKANQNYKSLETLNITFYDENNYERGGYFNFANRAVFSAITRVSLSSSTWTIKSKGAGQGLNDGQPNVEALNKYNGNLMNVFGRTNSNPTKDVVEQAWTRAYAKHREVLGLDTIITLEEQENLELLTSDETNEFIYGNNDIYYSVKEQKYYKMQLGTPVLQHYKLVPTKENSRIYQSFIELCSLFYDELPDGGVIQVQGNPFEVEIDVYNQPVILTEVPQIGVIKTTISPNRIHLNDAPFDMFAIPYNEDNYNLVQQINLKLATNIYDIQILPYCPVRRLIGNSGKIDINLGTEGIDYNKITGIGYESYILWADKSSDIFKIKHKIEVPNNNIDLKVYSETTFARIVSPNYNGIFEFNVAKNGGVDYFEVSFTYKPYSPYIHINPNFKGLYGQDFNDARGLQCNGDFSVSMTSDARKQYEINNKNYQNIFNTEIKTMDENQRLSMISKGISTALGGIGTGLVAGIVSGNPFFGLGAGIVSTGAGIADLGIAQDMFENSRQAKIDSFKLSLGNIKARPDSLTKVSAHNINNKYFPFVEIYSSTETEKNVLKNKIELCGMNLNFVGKINNIKDSIGFSFVKGTILRIDINEDSHFVQEINNRMQGGVYL